MAKFLKTAALVVGAVALVATGVGALASVGALGAGAVGAAGTVAGISTATIAAIGTFAGLGAAALGVAASLSAPKPSATGSGTTFTTNPQSGLPYAMGRTRMSGLRIYAKTNNTPGYTKFNDLLWFGALLSIGGQIEGIEKFTADNELVTFDAAGHAIGRFAGYMSQKVHLGGPQANGLAVTLNGGVPPGWTSAHRLSGMTHAMWGLRFNKQGDMYGAGAPEPAWIGKWVKVYDPRLDSTYPGGSGSCRALAENTYVWSDNPGLHALTWALGRWQNGLRTCGIGAPIANIRVHEFVECANVCEANDWKVGGVEWTTDSKWDTFKRILQAGGAIPTQTGAMIGCLVSTPRTAIATIQTEHLLDQLAFPSTKSRRERFNTVIPRYVDEASEWALISGSKVQVSEYIASDRGQRTKEIDFPLVQVFEGEQALQPGQLAAYCIVNSREAGPFSWSTGPEWAGLKTGDVIYLNVPTEGLVNQPILITKRAPDPATGKISFAGETETYSKHAYALGQSTTPPTPFSLTAPDLIAAAPQAAAWTLSGGVTGEGLPCLVLSGTPEHPSAEAVLVDYRVVGAADWRNSAILPATSSVLHVISSLASETLYEVRIGYRVGSIDGLYRVLPAVMTGAGKLSTIEVGATNGMNPSEAAQFAQLDADTAQALADIAAAEGTIATILGEVANLEDAIENINVTVTSAGGNRAPNPELAIDTSGWSFGQSGSSHIGARDLAGDFWRVTNEHNLGFFQSNNNPADYAYWVTEKIAVGSGTWQEFSAWLANHRCSSRLLMRFYPALGGAVVDFNSSDAAPSFSGGTNIDNWERKVIKAQMPSSGTVQLYFVKNGTTAPGATDSYAWMTRPQLVETVEDAVSPVKYFPGSQAATVRTQQTAIVAVAGQAATLQSNLAVAGAEIDTLQSVATTTTGQVAQINTKLSAGSPNLLDNGSGENGFTNWFSGYGSWGISNGNLWGSYFYVGSDGSTGAKYYHLRHNPVPFNEGYRATFAASIDFHANAGGYAYLEVRFYNSSGAVIGQYNGAASSNHVAFGDEATTREQLKCTTDVAPAGTVSAQATVVFFTPNGVNLAGGAFRQAKLEQGTVATPYSNEASVAQTFSALNTLNSQYAAINTTVSVQGVSVSQSLAAISTLNGNVTTLFGRAAIMLDVGGRGYGFEINGTPLAGGIKLHSDFFSIEKPGGGARLEYSGGNLRVYDSNNVLRVRLGVW